MIIEMNYYTVKYKEKIITAEGLREDDYDHRPYISIPRSIIENKDKRILDDSEFFYKDSYDNYVIEDTKLAYLENEDFGELKIKQDKCYFNLLTKKSVSLKVYERYKVDTKKEKDNLNSSKKKIRKKTGKKKVVKNKKVIKNHVTKKKKLNQKEQLKIIKAAFPNLKN